MFMYVVIYAWSTFWLLVSFMLLNLRNYRVFNKNCVFFNHCNPSPAYISPLYNCTVTIIGLQLFCTTNSSQEQAMRGGNKLKIVERKNHNFPWPPCTSHGIPKDSAIPSQDCAIDAIVIPSVHARQQSWYAIVPFLNRSCEIMQLFRL